MYKAEEIKKAESVDIVDYCMQNGIDVKSDNERYYRLTDHDSCVIDRKKNAFFWNSRGRGGNVINFLQEYEGIHFKEAMQRLLEEDKYQQSSKVEFVVEPYEYNPAKEVSYFDKAKSYLTKERKIDPTIVDDLHDRGLLKQDNRNNVLFLWKEYEQVMGCSEQGTIKTDKLKRGSWKSIQKNSTANYGFNVKYGEPKNLKFFESSIDLLSYASLNKEKLQDTQLISMEGLKHNTVTNYLLKSREELGDTPDSVSLCVDNDKAGKTFVEKFQYLQIKKNDGSKYDFDLEFPTMDGCKDWNDQLKKASSQREYARQQQYLKNKMQR